MQLEYECEYNKMYIIIILFLITDRNGIDQVIWSDQKENPILNKKNKPLSRNSNGLETN